MVLPAPVGPTMATVSPGSATTRAPRSAACRARRRSARRRTRPGRAPGRIGGVVLLGATARRRRAARAPAPSRRCPTGTWPTSTPGCVSGWENWRAYWIIACMSPMLERAVGDLQAADDGDQHVLDVAHEDHHRLDQARHELGAEARLVQLVVVGRGTGPRPRVWRPKLFTIAWPVNTSSAWRVEDAGVPPLRDEPRPCLAADELHHPQRHRHRDQRDHRQQRRDR